MPLAALLLVIASSAAARGETSGSWPAPAYTAASIVHAATNRAGELAPNTLATLYGKDLAYTTRVITPEDLKDGQLPTVLAGSGVRVRVGGHSAAILYVSPTQVNFLIPSNLLPQPVDIELVLDGRSGPTVRVELADTAPGLFQLDPVTVVAAHLDGSVVTPDVPARPDELVVLYAAGLGATTPPQIPGRIATTPAQITKRTQFSVWLDGTPLDSWAVLYCGVTPGFAGLYQVNVKLPADAPEDPEIRIAIGERVSPEGLRLPLKRAPPPETQETGAPNRF